jgi:hypothetical protein
MHMMLNYQDWKSYSVFFSATYTQAFLKNCYQKQSIAQAEQMSYQNCYPFIYYLEHGKIYYEQASVAPIIIRPTLLFYGFLHLIKACILTIDPKYPETTSVLAHGVSSRKRKKQQYSFLEDEVKIQKTGLFPFMADKLFHMKHFEGEKFTMGSLLTYIPEVSSIFCQLEKRQTFENVTLHDGHFLMSNKVLDSFHMTENRFGDFLHSKFNLPVSILPFDEESLKISIDNNNLGIIHPFRINILKKQYSFPLNKGDLFLFPEILIHYLLLYNLSMIARYETEWWSELLKMMSNNDFPFINSFLDTTIIKGPFLAHQFLFSKI